MASRSVRDLRELVCVSRLTFRGDDSDDDIDADKLTVRRKDRPSDDDDVITAAGSDFCGKDAQYIDSMWSSSSESLDIADDDDDVEYADDDEKHSPEAARFSHPHPRSASSEPKRVVKERGEFAVSRNAVSFDDASSGFYSSAGSSRRRELLSASADGDGKNAARGLMVKPSQLVAKRQQFLISSLKEASSQTSNPSTTISAASSVVAPRPPSSPRPVSSGSTTASSSAGGRGRAARVKLSPVKLAPIKNIPTVEELEERLEKTKITDGGDVEKVLPHPPLPPLKKGTEGEEEEEAATNGDPQKRRKKKKKKSKGNDSESKTKESSLQKPPEDLVLKDLSSGDEDGSKQPNANGPIKKKKKKKKKSAMPKFDLDSAPKAEDIDLVLDYTDSTVVSDWLQRANDLLQSLTDWCCAKDNFVQFANFWLSTFTDSDSQQLLELEYGIIFDELRLAFKSGLDSGSVKTSHFQALIKATFAEYPTKLFGATFGRTNFLNILQVLSCQSTDAYLELLKSVKYRTRNTVHAQWILSIRSFTLISIWSNVVNFFEKLHRNASDPVATQLRVASKEGETRIEVLSCQRAVQAVHQGYVAVLRYLINHRYVSPHMIDNQGRTLPFLAIMYNKPLILKFLLTLPPERMPDVNLPSQTGNTPLHAAANLSRLDLVNRLLEFPQTNPNVVNPTCDGSTPLHIAVMHGNSSIVRSLLKSGADASLKMGDSTPLNLAKEMEQEEVVKVFKSFGVES